MGKKKDHAKPNQKKQQQNLAFQKFKLWLPSAMFQLLTLLFLYGVNAYVIKIAKLPEVYLYSWLFLFGARISNVLISNFYIASDSPSSLVRLRRSLKIRNVISVLLLALIAFPVLYYSSFPLWLQNFLQSILAFSESLASSITQIVTIALSTVSGYIGNVLLGALGNLVYDIGKGIYNRTKKRNKKSVKNAK